MVTSRAEPELATLPALDDLGSRGLGGGVVGEHVARFDLAARELVVHLAGGGLVAEAVVDAREHPLDAHLDVGQQDRVVERVESRAGEEAVDEPRAR